MVKVTVRITLTLGCLGNKLKIVRLIMRISFISLLFSFFVGCTIPFQSNTSLEQTEKTESKNLIKDQSLIPLLDSSKKAKYAERDQILVDIDGDGVDDMLLSIRPNQFNTISRPWTVYLKRGKDYKPIGEIHAHPEIISFEPAKTRSDTDSKNHRFVRIWTYIKIDSCVGKFGYYSVGNDSVDKMVSLEIYPGSKGTIVGNAIIDATFEKSQIPFTMQTSETAEDGTVNWL
jgi:hypothetical protein